MLAVCVMLCALITLHPFSQVDVIAIVPQEAWAHEQNNDNICNIKLWQPTGVNANTSATNPPNSYVSGTVHTLYVLTDYGTHAVFMHLTTGMHNFTTATPCYKAFLSDKRH